MMFGLRTIIAAAACLLWQHAVTAQMTHNHSEKDRCIGTELACATKTTPFFAQDGTLWLAWMAGNHVSVSRSLDLGRSFAPAVLVNPEPLQLDWGPDARPKIVVSKSGDITVAFAYFKDKSFNGQVLYSRSKDGGQSFEAPRPITVNPESQRFEALALDEDGSLFAAWLDKRNRTLTREGEKYVGAGLAFAWSNDRGATFSEARIAQDNTCECCRLGVDFAAPGRPAVLFRNVFDKTTRDHAVMTFVDSNTPGPVRRVSVDDWKTDACPHHGPSLTISADGAYHVTWFTNGRERRGLFYAVSSDSGLSFSNPMQIGIVSRGPSHPYVIADRGAVWLTWKEFDGELTTVPIMVSYDGGRSWSEPRVAAKTAQTSDHPLLATNGHKVFLSWMTQAEGYRLISLEDTQ
jgi:hypothetical protein